MSDQDEALRLADALTTAAKQTDEEDQVVDVARWFVEDSAALLLRQHAENERLRAERDALRADAERYRWLLEESAKNPDVYSNDPRWMVSRAQGGMGRNFFGDGITAAIDAAREAK